MTAPNSSPLSVLVPLCHQTRLYAKSMQRFQIFEQRPLVLEVRETG